MKREDVIAVLEKVVQFSLTQETVPELTMLNIMSDKIQATDGYNGIEIDFQMGIEGYDCDPVESMLVPAETFYKLIKSIRAKEIIILKKEDRISVKTKKIIGTINCLTEGDFPKLSFSTKKLKSLSSNFLKALKMCRFAVANDESLGCRTGIIFHGRFAYGIDRFSIMRVDLREESDNVFVLPISLVNKLLKYESKIKGYAIKKLKNLEAFRIIFKIEDGISIFGSLIPFDLPGDPEKVIADCTEGKVIKIGKFPKEMSQAISRHCVILNEVFDVDKRICLKFLDGKFTIRTFSDKGRITERMKLSGDWDKGGKISFYINPLLLKDILAYDPEITVYEESFLMQFKGKHFRYYIFGEAVEK